LQNNVSTRLRPSERAPQICAFSVAAFGNGGPTAIICRRLDLMALCRRLPPRTAAFYLLVGSKGKMPILRPGETRDVEDRMRTHLNDPELAWFDRAVLVYGAAIDKTSAKALQYLAHERLLKLRSCLLGSRADAATPQRATMAKALPLFEQIRLLIAVHGEDWFEDAPKAVEPRPPVDKKQTAERVAVFEKGDFKATAVLLDGEWFVLAGSEIRARTQQSARPCDVQLRKELLEAGNLKPTPELPGAMVLLCDVRVSSLDAAGKFILANSRSLTRFWRDIGSEPSPRSPLF
jgi:hypothetical protein